MRACAGICAGHVPMRARGGCPAVQMLCRRSAAKMCGQVLLGACWGERSLPTQQIVFVRCKEHIRPLPPLSAPKPPGGASDTLHCDTVVIARSKVPCLLVLCLFAGCSFVCLFCRFFGFPCCAASSIQRRNTNRRQEATKPRQTTTTETCNQIPTPLATNSITKTRYPR